MTTEKSIDYRQVYIDQPPQTLQSRPVSTYLRLLILMSLLATLMVAGLFQNEITTALAGVISDESMMPIAHEFNCSFCHESSGADAMSAKDVTLTCISCHANHKADGHKAEADKVEDCANCHRIHAGTEDLLKAPKEVICQSCHNDQQVRIQNSEHVDISNSSGPCLSCHDAHQRSDHDFLKVSAIETCRSCHDDDTGRTGYSHPVGNPLIDNRTGGELTCTSTCHEPHGTGKPYLLRLDYDDGLCFKCHELYELS